MRARYLVRFDDICPTMNWSIWNEIEGLLDELQVRPLLAVVPDNRDPHLMVEPPDPNFWERVRRWERRGWTIAVHGYQHVYVSDHPGILGLRDRSEFAGLPVEEQEAKIRAALEIFRQEGVSPSVWVAPGHSFDSITLDILLKYGIRYISDGLCLFPYTDALGLTWVPQQLWRFRRMPLGVWTVCVHFSYWTSSDVNRFYRQLRKFYSSLASFEAVVRQYSGARTGIINLAASRILQLAYRTRRSFGRSFGK